MVDVTQSTNIEAGVLDDVARAAIGAGCSGVSNRAGAAVIHVSDQGQNIQKATSILTNWDTLLITADKNTITADNADTAVITHDTVDATVDYYVWLDGAEYAAGEVAAVGGVVTLNLATDTPGSYRVWIARKAGNYATGSTIIEAVES